MVEENIKQLIAEALQTLGLEGEVNLEHPSDLSHGDFSCNIAMVLAKRVGKNPRELAEDITRMIQENESGGENSQDNNGLKGNTQEFLFTDHEFIEKLEVAGAGFINFYLTPQFFSNTTKTILERANTWGKSDTMKGKKVMVEYTDPNPFKELHIGHLVPNALGESLARLHEYTGAEVRRVTFQGDVGMHVAKALWGLQKNGFKAGDTITASDLGKAYATGATAFEEDVEVAEEIKSLNKVIYQRSDEDTNALYDAGKATSISYFEEAYNLLGSKFDNYFFESVTGPLGQALVEKNIGTIFEESDGVIIFKGEEHGLHTRVFVNKEGLPTYETKDIGLIIAKKEWWPFDTAITVTGTEQESYFKVVSKAAELLMPETANSIKLVPNGMLKLTEGKMSSRTGDVIPATVLIQDLTQRVVERAHSDIDTQTAQNIAVSAIKYAILKNTTGKDIIFDPNNSLSLEGDTGPYLQYTYARARSILDKAGEEDAESFERHDLPVGDVEKLLYRFPAVVKRATREYEPHYVANYLLELASAYNSWYGQEQVLDGGEAEGYKVALTHAVAQTLKNGLWVLGIEAPEKM